MDASLVAEDLGDFLATFRDPRRTFVNSFSHCIEIELMTMIIVYTDNKERKL